MAPGTTNGSASTRTKSPPADDAPAELSAVVDELLNSLSSKFTTVSAEIFSKMDEMSRRLDNLESTLQANETGKGTPTKS